MCIYLLLLDVLLGQIGTGDVGQAAVSMAKRESNLEDALLESLRRQNDGAPVASVPLTANRARV